MYTAGVVLLGGATYYAVTPAQRTETVLADVSGDGETATRLPAPDGTWTGSLCDSLDCLRVVEQESGNDRHAWLGPGSSCVDGGCWALDGYAAPTATTADRLEVELADQYQVRYGGDYSLAFSVRVDELSGDGAPIVAQVWQHSSVAYGSRPALGPVAYVVVSRHSDPAKHYLTVRVRSEVSSDNPSVEVWRESRFVGKWTHVVLDLAPRTPGPGGLRVATGGVVRYDSTTQWGYAPDPETKLGDGFQIRIGAYRPAPQGAFRATLDSVRLEAY
jgi:hypothetical protein